MPKFAANITTMFQEHPVSDRCQAAAACGFTAVEFLSPYDHQPADISAWLADSRLALLLINISPGKNGETGTAALPGREDFFRDSFMQSLDYAVRLRAPMIHVLAGKATDELALSRKLFVENIRWAADQAGQHGITLNLEPLNDQDVPGYLHTTSDKTIGLLREIDKPNVRLQFDFYHQQIMGGNLGNRLTRELEHISHIQFSSVPGRHEPQHGEVNVHHLFSQLDQMGYEGWVGCEYWPKTSTLDGLDWAKDYGITP